MKKRIFISLSFLILGSIIYLLFDLNLLSKSNTIFIIIRNYIPDICWTFSFFFMCINFTKNIVKNDLLINSLYVFIIGVFFELLQYFNIAKGTFDFLDIFVCIISIILSSLMEKFLRRIKNEKVS